MGHELSDLEAVVGHRFRSRRLLIRALTHSSVGGRRDTHLESNERLEFLGDRVLGLVVADMLYARFPDEAEGSLAKRHAALVCREALARVAATIGLPGHLVLSRGEEEAGGRLLDGLVADACEALIAAIFLDAGFEAAQAFVQARWEPLLDADVIPPQDPKTALQEWAQGHGLPLPEYEEVSRQGPAHAPSFTVRAEVVGLDPVTAEGSSKRVAEREAARLLLERVIASRHA